MQWGRRRTGAEGRQVRWSLSLPINIWIVHLCFKDPKVSHTSEKHENIILPYPRVKYIEAQGFETLTLSEEVFTALKTPESSERTSSLVFHLSENPQLLYCFWDKKCVVPICFLLHVPITPILQRVSQLRKSTHHTDQHPGMPKCLLIHYWHLLYCYMSTKQTSLSVLKTESRGQCDTNEKQQNTY